MYRSDKEIAMLVLMLVVTFGTGLGLALVTAGIVGPVALKSMPAGSALAGFGMARAMRKGRDLELQVAGACMGTLGWVLALILLGVTG